MTLAQSRGAGCPQGQVGLSGDNGRGHGRGSSQLGWVGPGVSARSAEGQCGRGLLHRSVHSPAPCPPPCPFVFMRCAWCAHVRKPLTPGLHCAKRGPAASPHYQADHFRSDLFLHPSALPEPAVIEFGAHPSRTFSVCSLASTILSRKQSVLSVELFSQKLYHPVRNLGGNLGFSIVP